MIIDQRELCAEGQFEQVKDLSDHHYIAPSVVPKGDCWSLTGAADVGGEFVEIASFRHESHAVFFAQQMQAISGGPPYIELSKKGAE